MHKSLIVVVLSVAFVSANVARAQSTPRVDKRQEQQDKRIDKGIASGQVNEKEAARLEKGQKHVQKMENKATSDGKVTKQEKRRLEHAQDQQNKRINRERQDKQDSK